MAARRVAALDIWMNGLFVGQWQRSSIGQDLLVYAPDWIAAEQGRPLSLSLPFGGGAALRGAAVAAYFDNLIPDNEQILRRLQQRHQLRSTAAFDLLAELGRDCAGAVQLMPEGEEPDDHRRIDAEALSEARVAALLRNTVRADPLGLENADEFRLSIAGAQEKTALLWHRKRWCRPRGATPSTHIFKLPLGLVANVQADMRDSVELEWLSLEILREFGLPVAHAQVGRFEDQKVLIVERFDRRLAPDKKWWMRIPQEDFCQVNGISPLRKYEADGGPGIGNIMEVLRGSEFAQQDRTTFFSAQFLFWLMAATDGHAKNFSLAVGPQGRYRMTPLYDVISVHPVVGRKNNQLDQHRLKLAMAVQGSNRHYRLDDIHRWHWVEMGRRLGLPEAAELTTALAEHAPAALDRVAAKLPDDFPQYLYEAVCKGLLNFRRRFLAEPERRG
jgi:serine/threonine-protein kinase HipA